MNDWAPMKVSAMEASLQLPHCWQYSLSGTFHTLAGGVPTEKLVHVVFSVPWYLPKGSMTRTWNTGAFDC